MASIKDLRRLLVVVLVVLAVTAQPANCDESQEESQDVQEGKFRTHSYTIDIKLEVLTSFAIIKTLLSFYILSFQFISIFTSKSDILYNNT